MEGLSPEVIVGMLVAAVAAVAAAVGVLYQQLVKSGERRIADLITHYDAQLATKDREIAARDQEIGHLNAVITQLRDRGSHGRPAGGAT